MHVLVGTGLFPVESVLGRGWLSPAFVRDLCANKIYILKYIAISFVKISSSAVCVGD